MDGKSLQTADDQLFEKLEYYCNNAPNLQMETLEAILNHNAAAEYLQRHGLNNRTDLKSFKECIPLTSYSDYTHEIQRIAEGDKSSILSSDPLLCMFFSSGTSSQQPKLIPHFDSELSRRGSKFVRQIAAATVRKLYPLRLGYKSLSFMYAGKVMETKGGVKAMAATAYGMRNPQDQNVISMYISPPQVFLGTDIQQQLYCHLLCGLRVAEAIDSIKAPYAHGLLKAFRFLESQWQQLCEDIHNGYINQNVISDSAMRKAVEEVLAGPEPDIAERLQIECCKGEWGGIVGRLWPNARYVSCVMTGSMEQYYLQIRHYVGEVALLGGDFLASECSVGVNLDRTHPPQQTLFTIVPIVAYYEFVCVDDKGVPDTDIAPVDLCDAEVGKMYEVVATTFRGLYRYRLGDIVRVRGFYGCTPQVEYVSKVCSCADIVSEKQLMDVMGKIGQNFRDEAQMEILDYAFHADLSLSPKHIQLFWELKNGPSLEELHNRRQYYEKLFRRYCLLVEEYLNEGEYLKMVRMNGNMVPLEVCIVREGSFQAIMDVAMQKGAIASQYKPPSIIRNREILDLLRAATLFK
ncbi:hypothetical protein KI387_028482, partial [Taxus chinensis]